jgi:hypothetical protein
VPSWAATADARSRVYGRWIELLSHARRCEVTAHSLTHAESRQSRVRRVRKNGLLQLGWFHFWLLAAILGGMLALVALVFFARFVSL